MPVKKITVKEGNKQQDVYIAMTEEEASDGSYVDYIEEAQQEKVSEKIKKSKPKEESSVSNEDKVNAIKEWMKHRDEKRNRSGPKYFSGF